MKATKPDETPPEPGLEAVQAESQIPDELSPRSDMGTLRQDVPFRLETLVKSEIVRSENTSELHDLKSKILILDVYHANPAAYIND